MAESIGDRFTARLCRFSEGWARAWQGDHARAQALYDALIDEAAAEHDVVTRMYSLATKGFMLAFVGEAGAAAEVADAALDCNAKLTGAFVRFKIFDADYERMLDELRNTMGSNDFEAAWAEGADC